MRARTAFLSLFVFVAACNDKPKTETHTIASAEPIPSDLVYNSFLDDKSNAAKLVVATDGGAMAMSDAGGASSTGSTAKLVDPGADPKAPLVYAFAPKPRTVTATIKIVAAGGPQGMPEQPPFKFTFTATPKAKFGLAGDATIDVKITKFEIVLPPNAPPQAAQGKDQLEKALAGVAGHFDATTHGDISNLDFETEHGPQGVSEVVSVMQQALELLVVPFPNEAVGVGAKWAKTESKRMADQGATVSTTVNLTLLARDATSATIKVEATNSGSTTVNDPRAPKGTMMQRNTTASYTVTARFDGVSQKVEGESKNDVIQKIPGQADQAMSIKINQSLESK